MKVALLLHLLGTVIWVGGMFFAHMALRPVAAGQLPPPQRLALMAGVFRRFFPWVWISVLLILATGGYLIVISGGMGGVHWTSHVMLLIGIVMFLIFARIFFSPFVRLKHAVVLEDWSAGGAALGEIRKLIAINLPLGLLNIAIAKLGTLL